MTPEAHRQRHQALHQALDELLADWLAHTALPPGATRPAPVLQRPVQDLIEWSYRQTLDPTPVPGTHDAADPTP